MNMLKTFILAFVLLPFFASAESTENTALEYEFSQAELDQILAPIALYPDTVLSHILIASTYPLEVIQAERWTRENPKLKDSDALAAVESKDWDASVKALVPFPHILKQMSKDLDWMQKLGDAFLQDETLVLASIQELRTRAYEKGSLNDLDHLEVTHEDDGDIIIEPSVREVVYVPYYDSRVVYGSWWWADYPPFYWTHHRHHYVGTRFYWGPRVHVGTGIYFSSFHWRNRHVVVINRHHHHRHRFHSGRHVARHVDSRHWAHNPRHRRGVSYRVPHIRDRHNAHRRHSSRSDKRAYIAGRNNLNLHNGRRTGHRSADTVERRLRRQPDAARRDNASRRDNSPRRDNSSARDNNQNRAAALRQSQRVANRLPGRSRTAGAVPRSSPRQDTSARQRTGGTEVNRSVSNGLKRQENVNRTRNVRSGQEGQSKHVYRPENTVRPKRNATAPRSYNSERSNSSSRSNHSNSRNGGARSSNSNGRGARSSNSNSRSNSRSNNRSRSRDRSR